MTSAAFFESERGSEGPALFRSPPQRLSTPLPSLPERRQPTARASRALSSPRRATTPASPVPAASKPVVGPWTPRQAGGRPCCFAASLRPIASPGSSNRWRGRSRSGGRRQGRGQRASAIAQQHDHMACVARLEVGASHDAAILRPSGCCSISASVRGPLFD
jgi:hypothetical protein